MILYEIENLIKTTKTAILEEKQGFFNPKTKIYKFGSGLGKAGSGLAQAAWAARTPLAVAGLTGLAYKQGMDDTKLKADLEGTKLAGRLISNDIGKNINKTAIGTALVGGAAGWHFLNKKNQPKEERSYTPSSNFSPSL